MNENKPRVVVLGGSFNPPTTAHRALLLHAMRHAHANEGVFVPSSDAYVTRKATRARTPRIFSEAERLDMLLAMTEDEPGLDVSTCEYGDTSSGRSHLTMRDVQREHPDAECCFIVGADKLRVIPRWRSIGAFMDEFKFVVLSRAEDDARAIIRANNFLTHNEDRIIVIPDMAGYDDVSSSACQRLMYAAGVDAARHMLHPKVAEYIERIT